MFCGGLWSIDVSLTSRKRHWKTRYVTNLFSELKRNKPKQMCTFTVNALVTFCFCSLSVWSSTLKKIVIKTDVLRRTTLKWQERGRCRQRWRTRFDRTLRHWWLTTTLTLFPTGNRGRRVYSRRTSIVDWPRPLIGVPDHGTDKTDVQSHCEQHVTRSRTRVSMRRRVSRRKVRSWGDRFPCTPLRVSSRVTTY